MWDPWDTREMRMTSTLKQFKPLEIAKWALNLTSILTHNVSKSITTHNVNKATQLE